MPQVAILTNKEELNFTGEEFKGDGFYGYADDSIQLVSHVSGFQVEFFVMLLLKIQQKAIGFY